MVEQPHSELVIYFKKSQFLVVAQSVSRYPNSICGIIYGTKHYL